MTFLSFEKLRLDLKPPVLRPATAKHAPRLQTTNYIHTNKLINAKFEPPTNKGRDTLRSKSNFSFSTFKTGQNSSSTDFSFASENQILRKASALLKRETVSSKFLLENASSPKSAKSANSMYNYASIGSIAEEYSPLAKTRSPAKSALIRTTSNQASFSPFKEVSFYEPTYFSHRSESSKSLKEPKSSIKLSTPRILSSRSDPNSVNEEEMKENESVLSDESLEDYKQPPRSYLAYSSRSNTRVSTFQKSSSRSIFSSGCSSNPAAKKFFQRKVRVLIAILKLSSLLSKAKQKNYQLIDNAIVADQTAQSAFNEKADMDRFNIFDRNLFKAGRHMAFSASVQGILRQPPEDRKPEQIRLVLEVLKSRLKSINEYPEEIQEKICRCAILEMVPPKRIILREKQMADRFYFIVSGQAMVSKIEVNEETFEMKNKVLAILKDGSSFGELAFIYNTTRNATVTSLTNMELISIGRQDYVDMFMSAAKEELPDHVKYLATCSFTKGWPIEKLKKYSTACQVHYYRRGEVIVKNTTKCDFIYVVRSGKCQVLKKLSSVKPMDSALAKSIRCKETAIYDIFKPKIDTGLRREKVNRTEIVPASSRETNQTCNSKEQRSVFIQLQLLKAGDVFGLSLLKFDETDNDQPNPEVSLVSLGAEIIMLSAETFLKYSNEKIRDNVRNQIQPYPLTVDLQKKLQTHVDWSHFRTKTLKKFYCDFEQKKMLTSKFQIRA